jgi:hypothetical protein
MRTPMRNAQVGSGQSEFKPWCGNNVTLVTEDEEGL